MFVPVKTNMAVKYALHKDQTEELFTFFLKSFGCVRKVYNLYTDILYKILEKSDYVNGDDIPDVKIPEVTEFKRTMNT